MSPSGPCFEVGPKGYFAFTADYSSTQTATTLGALGGFFEKTTVFDRDGRKWRATGIKVPFKKSWWRVLLANTVYNPRVSVTVEWQRPTEYRIEELKQAYSKAVDQDDDILTQFVEAPELKKKIAEAQTFDDLMGVYRWMGTEQPYEEKA